GAKVRHSDTSVTITALIGEVAGRDVIVLDDEIARGTTIMELLSVLRDRGARSVRIACTHGLFCDGALERISARPEVQEIVCTNTVPVPASTVKVGTAPAGTVPGSKAQDAAAGPPAPQDEDGVAAAKAKLHVISVAPALAEAIRRIHEGESVSALFDPS
ncbi:MAG TPA: phosphoribosyltransferase family protein, partial [Streptosporangiaceae bacterium]|nr:phosphoribosyltransferase family protein [Streptosporangiaceae bacterium]